MATIDSIQGMQALPLRPTTEKNGEAGSADFGEIVQSMIEKVNDSQLAGEQAVRKLHSGEASHLHEVMIAVEEADVSMRMLVQLRNRAQTAYEEIMRMQV